MRTPFACSSSSWLEAGVTYFGYDQKGKRAEEGVREAQNQGSRAPSFRWECGDVKPGVRSRSNSARSRIELSQRAYCFTTSQSLWKVWTSFPWQTLCSLVFNGRVCVGLATLRKHGAVKPLSEHGEARQLRQYGVVTDLTFILLLLLFFFFYHSLGTQSLTKVQGLTHSTLHCSPQPPQVTCRRQ